MKTKLLLIILCLTVFYSNGQDINVKVVPTNYTNGSTYTFVNTNVGSLTDVVFRVENISTTGPTLQLTGVLNEPPFVQIGGTDSDQFIVKTQPSTGTLPFGTGRNFTISFKPTTVGIKTAKFIIESNDPTEAVYEVILTGEGKPVVSATTDFFRTKSDGNWTDVSTWQSNPSDSPLGWIDATLAPNSDSANIIIGANHTVITTTNLDANQITVSFGGTLKISGGTFTVTNGLDDDLRILGTLEYANGILIQSSASIISILSTGTYLHSIASNNLTLPTINWLNGSTCRITGLTNATPITAVNMGQNFSNLIWDNQNQGAFVNINDAAFNVSSKLVLEAGITNKLCLGSTGILDRTIGRLEVKGGELVGYAANAKGVLTIENTKIENGIFTFSTSSARSTLNNTSSFTVNGGQFIFANEAGSNTFNAGADITVNNSGTFMFANLSDANLLSVYESIKLNQNSTFIFNSNSKSSNLSVGNSIILNDTSKFIFNDSGLESNLSVQTSIILNNDSKFTFNNSASEGKLIAGGSIILNDNSIFVFNNSSGINQLETGLDLKVAGAGMFICSSNLGSSTITFRNDLILEDSGSLVLENYSSEDGVTELTVSRDLKCLSNATKAIDFGYGDVSGNTIFIRKDFIKSGSGTFTKSSTTTSPRGFIFLGSTQGFSYTGAPSSGVNFTVNTAGVFSLNDNYQFITATPLPETKFFVNQGTLNLGSNSFIGNAAKAMFTIASTVTVETTNPAGLGGTTATGSFTNFNSIGSVPTIGQVSFGSSVNYKFNASQTETPFPVGGTWPTPNDITIGGAGGTGVVTINYTNPFTLNGILKVETGKVFRLNPTTGANLTIKKSFIINGTFDTNSNENQVLGAGAAPSILLNGTFITRDKDGFNGTDASVPATSITMGTDLALVHYAGNDQTITNFPNYKNLLISGTGIKNLATDVIRADKTLEVVSSLLEIEPNKTLAVADKITTVNTDTTNGIIVRDGGSILQINDVNNIGNIRAIRIAKPMFRYDFTYWSSPITNSTAFTLSNLSPTTFFDKYFKWNDGTQAWQKINYGTEVMVPGRGYSVRAPQTYLVETPGAISQIFAANFVGVPNNGTITYPISGSAGSDKWNLLGNPYPSALDAAAFINANDSVINGTLYFWTHNTAANNGGSGVFFTYNSADYASWNTTGSTATSTNTGTNANFSVPTGKIASGQSFFIKGKVNGVVTFNNTMRQVGENNQFFKISTTSGSNAPDKHRVWLNLKGTEKGFSQTLVGYVPDATNAYDSRFDGESFGGNQVTLYSILENKNLVIQGRALPFNAQDEVPLGYKTTLTGNLSISIDHTDGLLTDHVIYLKDNLLHTIHNLKNSPYSFAVAPGTDNTRFVLRYQPLENLANPAFDDTINGVIIRKNTAEININSAYETIRNISIYDLTGRLVFEQKDCNCSHFQTANVVSNQQVLFVKVQLNNGAIVSQKVW